MKCWGKTQPNPGGGSQPIGLSLSHHCLDVACVFRELTRLPAIHSRLNAAADIELDATDLDRLAVLAFLHDLGKANRGFQAKLAGSATSKAGHIRELGPLLFEEDLALRLQPMIAELLPWISPTEDCERFLLASWSHHGDPLSLVLLSERTPSYEQARTRWWRTDTNGYDPLRAAADLLACARQHFPAAYVRARPLPSTPALQHRFAGLVMLADWLGSHQAFFPLPRDTSFDTVGAARQAVRTVGLDCATHARQLAGTPRDFSGLFGFSPRPLQDAIQRVRTDDPDNHLLVIEAETGSGKTEAALLRYFQLLAGGCVDSLYFALPTRVAAREIYGRVCDYVMRVFPHPVTRPPVLLAVPGYARVDNLPQHTVLCPQPPGDDMGGRAWAAERPKRFLAAPIAVGTIDQALLSVLAVRHAHLRSVCLDRSLLVVDEVHASDPYMRSLLEQLLAHHVGTSGHALLLSATLGSHARARLVRAAGGEEVSPDFTGACAVPYPRITPLGGGHPPIAASNTHTKRVHFVLSPALERPEQVLDEVAQMLASGARVLAVFNTVSRAVAFQRASESHPAMDPAWLFSCRGITCPHHGRFAPTDREVLDATVSQRFGRSSAPGPVLLVGTQTLEQSLDIDADLLLTDLCPADVLLQRVGRLHRHRRSRPPSCAEARCLVMTYTPTQSDHLLQNDGEPQAWLKAAGLGSVYEDLRAVELTRRLLAETPDVTLPDHNRLMVESATHPQQLAALTHEAPETQRLAWTQHQQKVEGTALAQQVAAHYAAAHYGDPFGEASIRSRDLEARARTRLGLDSLIVALDQSVTSPFGQSLAELVVPGHLVPASDVPEEAHVLEACPGLVRFALGPARYAYSRFGLERDDDVQQPAH